MQVPPKATGTPITKAPRHHCELAWGRKTLQCSSRSRGWRALCLFEMSLIHHCVNASSAQLEERPPKQSAPQTPLQACLGEARLALLQ